MLESKELNIEVKDGVLKGINKFFTATYVDVDGEKEFTGDKKSFRCFTCLDGEGMIGDMLIKKGESVFVPATLGDFVVTGNFTAIITTIRKYYLKNGTIENDLGEIIAEGNDEKELLKKCTLTAADILNK